MNLAIPLLFGEGLRGEREDRAEEEMAAKEIVVEVLARWGGEVVRLAVIARYGDGVGLAPIVAAAGEEAGKRALRVMGAGADVDMRRRSTWSCRGASTT